MTRDPEPRKALNRRRLEAALKRVEPTPLLLSPRVLRRVIKQHHERRGVSVRVPRRKSFVVEREVLTASATARELGVSSLDALEERRYILVVEPDEERLRRGDPQAALRFYWRHLYHALIELTLRRRVDQGTFPRRAVLELADAIGQAEMDAIQAVLVDEHRLHPPRDRTETVIAFTAAFLELEAFAPVLLEHTFPGLDHEAVLRRLSRIVDPTTLLEQSRPEGASEPDRAAQRERMSERASEGPPLRGRPPKPDDRRARSLLGRADEARTQGNDVRAALLAWRAAGHAADGEVAKIARSAAHDHLQSLCERLVRALDDDHGAEAWFDALERVLEPASRGLRSVESRLLYDLQKVCLDEEEEIYAVGLMEWALSLGRRPLTRPLPSQREVLVVKHLRHAAKRAARMRIGERPADALRDLLRRALSNAERALRRAFRGVVEGALREAGLEPDNLPERAAAHKLTEELLDRVIERGFLAIGDVRDAISRNSLKLDDLEGPRAFIFGDPLLRLDDELTDPLDGVYRPGEVYMRGLQRLSALVFGTPLGRFITRYLILPFGGAFVILAGLQHTVGVLIEMFTGVEPAIQTPPAIIVAGVVAFALIHSTSARRAAVRGLSAVGTALKRVFWDWPARLLRLPWVRRVLESFAWRAFSRVILRPAIASALLILLPVWALARPGPEALLWIAIGGWAGFALLFALPIGRLLEEAVVDWAVRNWEHVQRRIIPGLIRWILDLFKALVDGLERVLYAVDEWLRFRRGEPRLRKIVKGTLGFVWFFITYVVRFYVNLLIEPQINPIKHFPVVTVSHKLMIPMLPTLAELLAQPLAPLGPVLAQTIAWSTVTLLPGVFGFLVWELKENWKLYDANRPDHLQPELIGHHGESMIKFMKPGFHSGTLPKLYRKLRRAEARALTTGDTRRARRLAEGLHHVSHAIHRFVDRELVWLLEQRGLHLHVDAVHLAANRVTVIIHGPSDDAPPLRMRFEEQSGWLVANIQEPGFLPTLSDPEAERFRVAIAGLYHKSGVDLVREQIRTHLPEPLHYDIADAGLLVWSEDHLMKARYRLRGEGPITRRGAELGPETLPRDALLFSERQLPWLRWLAMWEMKEPELRGFDDVRLLP